MMFVSASATFQGVVGQLPERVLQIFAAALRLRSWPDGTELTDEQRLICSEVLALRAQAGGLAGDLTGFDLQSRSRQFESTIRPHPNKKSSLH